MALWVLLDGCGKSNRRSLQLFSQLLYLSLHAFDPGFGVFVVGDDNFGEFGLGLFQLYYAI